MIDMRYERVMIVFFCGGGGGFVFGGGALLVGGGSVCDDLVGFSTGDEVMLTSHPVLAHCAPPPPPLYPPQTHTCFGHMWANFCFRRFKKHVR